MHYSTSCVLGYWMLDYCAVGWTACYWQRWTKFGCQVDLAWTASFCASANQTWIDHLCMENDMIGVIALLEASAMNLQAALKYTSSLLKQLDSELS